jgi:hypothetical protein
MDYEVIGTILAVVGAAGLAISFIRWLEVIDR